MSEQSFVARVVSTAFVLTGSKNARVSRTPMPSAPAAPARAGNRLGKNLALLNVEREHRVHNRCTAVYVDDLTRNKTRFIHTQQHDGIADVLWRAQAAHRCPPA